ncbi:hypothetical protein M2266_003516 [Streptomyces sp. SPB162]|nr:hypothetical protein [Streptomyces sp. SPB162]
MTDAAAGNGPDDLYGRLAVHVGQIAAAGGEGRDPVNEPMIRHWCEATGHAVPADGSAPATMLQVWTMAGLSGHTAGTARAGAYDDVLTLLDDAGYTSVVATDCEQEYLRPLRPGDRITYDAVIESISPRKTTKLGTGHFVTTRMDVRANGELSGTHRFRILKYAPAATRKPTAEATRPRPVVNRDNAAYWEGLERHELLIQRCSGCGTLRLPWLPGCNACGSPDWDTVAASGESEPSSATSSCTIRRSPPSTRRTRSPSSSWRRACASSATSRECRTTRSARGCP